VWLAFVTDGDVSQVCGITLLIEDLQHLVGPRQGVFILCPQRAEDAVIGTLKSGTRDVAVVPIITPERGDDRYYIQLGLSNVFTSINDDEQVLCLDYDHLMLDSGMAPACWPTDYVWVSSEIYYQFDPDILRCGEDRKLAILPSRHIGASLIFGCGRTLRPIARQWKDSYDDIVELVGNRHRVEIALAMAAERSGVNVCACPGTVQGNFAIGCGPCWIFHYGGESSRAARVKALLAEESRCLRTSSADVRALERLKCELVRACFPRPLESV
jgi:hypothetical protein